MIYKNIVRLCEERNISIRSVEIACGLGNGTIKGWESGNPRIDLLNKVAKYFGLTIDDLLSDPE